MVDILVNNVLKWMMANLEIHFKNRRLGTNLKKESKRGMQNLEST